MTCEEAIKYIHSINWTFTKPGLERIGELCARLGDPQKHLRFIHVAGTNGKGSFCSMLDCVLRAAGYKTGLFTSPYITEFTERIRYCGENIDGDELAAITEYVKPYADAMADKPTEFELITAIGLEYFRRKSCDVVVLEAGMGGRLDSTNVIDESVLSVITGISLEHTAYLGDTVEKIAAEKAGIIKRNGTVLFGGEDGAAARVIAERAAQMNAEFAVIDKSTLSITHSDLFGSTLDYGKRKGIAISLSGLYQPHNAANVIAAADALVKKGFSISEDALRRGLAEARWQARFEVISRSPLIIFDGAHNPEGIKKAVESVKYYFGEQRVLVLTGVMKDKDYRYIAACLSEIAAAALTVTPDNPRALDAQEYAKVLTEAGVDAAAYASPAEAVRAGKALAAAKDIPLVCLGSLYMYGEIKECI